MESSHGLEWLVEAHGCDPSSLSGLPALQRLFAKLIGDLGLHPVGATQWHQFPETGGITGICLLSESHLACHTFPEHGSMCLNVFCCRARDEWPFQEQLRNMFGARKVMVRAVVRPYGPQSLIDPLQQNRAAVGGQA